MKFALIQVHEINSAEDLLDLFRSYATIWKGDRGAWVFRGQGDADWRLIPSAARKKSWQRFAPEQMNFDPETDPLEVVIEMERDLNSAFRTAHRRSGLQQSDGLERLMLAQHHGMPTRLLDWSERPHVAAYFAATQAIESATTKMAVWALKTLHVALLSERLPNGPVELYPGDRFSNQNLHAQDGVMLYWRRLDLRMDPLEDLLAEERQTYRTSGLMPGLVGPSLIRLELPTSEAPKLLPLLSADNVNAATLFPNVYGVVQHLRDQALWDTALGDP